MRYAVFCLVMVCLLAAPVSAGYTVTGGNIDLENTISGDNARAFTFTANPDEKIGIIEFDIPIDTTVNFTLYYGSGSVVSGWAIYRVNTPLVNSYTEVAIDTSVYSKVFMDPLISGYSITRVVKFSSYARNDSATDESGFAVYAQGYGIWNSEIAYFPVVDLPNNLIYRVDFTSDQPISFTVDTARADVLASHVSTTVAEEQQGVIGLVGSRIASLYDFGMMIKDVVLSLLYWLKLIFVDNLVLTVCLYFMGTMAYCANTSRNIFEFYRKFFGFQRSMFEFIASAFKMLLDMIVSVKSLIPFLK